jgi:hypothetical protein
MVPVKRGDSPSFSNKSLDDYQNLEFSGISCRAFCLSQLAFPTQDIHNIAFLTLDCVFNKKWLEVSIHFQDTAIHVWAIIANNYTLI